MKILIAYDGTDSANAALEDLPCAGLPDEADALILVTNVWLASSPTEFSRAVAWRRMLAAEGSSFAPALRDEEEERALSREARRRLLALFPAWRVRAQAAGGAATAGAELARTARSWGADLIVVGSEGRGWRDQSFGVAPRAVAAVAPCSVRIARPSTAAPSGPLRLLVGVGGSPEPCGALRAVASREWPAGSEGRVISSAPLDPCAVESLRAAGLKVSGGIREGDRQRALLDEAERWGADCIFVDADGLEGEGGLRGSLIAPLFADSPCSFELARISPRASADAHTPLARAPFRAASAGAR
jgi:nucleotide-binding universal stress UspA family protein